MLDKSFFSCLPKSAMLSHRKATQDCIIILDQLVYMYIIDR